MLALLYGLFGHRYLPVYLFQLALGLAVVVLVHDTTRRLFDGRAALVAAAGAALYKPLIFHEAQIEKTALAVALAALLLWAAVRSLESPRARWPALAGVALGIASLARTNLLLFVPLLPLGLAAVRWRRARAGSPHPAPGRHAWAAALAGALAVVAPVAARNSLLGGELLLTSTQFGQNLFIGNNPGNPTGQYLAPPWVRAAPEYEEADFAAHAEAAAGRRLSAGEVSGFYAREVLRWALDRPADFLRTLGRKAAIYLNDYEYPDTQDLGFFGRYSPVLRLPLPGFGVVLALGGAGLLLLAGRNAPRLFLAGYLLIGALAVIAFFVLSRYRLPAVPALLPFVGGFAVRIWDDLRSRGLPGRVRRVGAGLALAAAGMALGHLPVQKVPPSVAGAQTLANLGARLYEEGDRQGAARAFEEALALDPGRAGTLRSLGIIAYERGDAPRARAMFDRALAASPGDAAAWYYRGRLGEEAGDREAALADLARAVELAPARTDFRMTLAQVLLRAGDPAAALAQLDQLAAAAPADPAVRFLRVEALRLSGREAGAAAVPRP